MTKFSHALIAAAALAFGGAASAANLVTNGDFETGDLTGWKLSGDTSATEVETWSAISGSYSMAFGSLDSDAYLTQTLGVSSTASYIVSFDLYNDSVGEDDEDFTISFGGTKLMSDTIGTSDVTHYSFEVTGGNGVLQIASMNNPGYWFLDNVSVTAVSTVPEASSSATLLAGIAMLGFAALRRRSAR